MFSPARLRARLVTRVALVPILAASLLALASGAPAQAAPAARAMWVWDTSTPKATVDFAVAHGIGQLYAAVPPRVGTSPQLAQLRELSERGREAGLRVDALGGDPGWIDNQTWVVENWLKPALATGLFTGVHVDIEPYSTAAWQTKRATVVKRWLATVDTLRSAAGGAPLEADIPFWLNEIPANGSTLDREIIRRTSGVTVMAYRNQASGADGTVALAAAAVSAGEALGRQVRIGQETNHLGDDAVSAKQTFHGHTRTEMEVQLAEVDAAFAGGPGYAGVAIHDATGYAAMAP